MPDRNDAQRNPAGSTWYIRDAASNGNIFSYNMRTGQGTSTPAVALERNGDSLTLVIYSDAITNFIIVYDFTSDVSEPPIAGVRGVQLLGNTPNPFEGTTSIRFRVAEPTALRLEVYDALGNRVATLAEGVYPAGEHSVVWDGTTQQGDRLPSGVYYYRLLVEGQTVVRPMVIVR